MDSLANGLGRRSIGKKLAQGRVATVAINSMTFLKPVHVGDVVSCHVDLIKQGNTSMTMGVEVWALPATQRESLSSDRRRLCFCSYR